MIKGKLHDPVIPPIVQRELALVGGRHPLYNENPTRVATRGLPLYRLVWGQKRLHWVGGKFEHELDSSGKLLPAFVATKREPRYFGPESERWILERWVPTNCSAKTWYDSNRKWIDGYPVDQLGPYPERGDYEEVISLPPEVLMCPEFFQYVIQAVNMSRDIAHSVRRAHLLSQHEKREDAWRADAEAMLSDTPRSYLRPSIVVPQSYQGAT